MPVPAFPCCRWLPERPQRRARSSSTAFSWFRHRCFRRHSVLPAHSTAPRPYRAVRSSSCSRPSCTETMGLGRRLIVCSCSRFPTCSCCSRPSWQTTVVGSDMRYGFLAIALIAVATLGGCSEGVLAPKGPIAEAERQILFNSLGIMLAIVLPTIVAILGVAFWFRSSNGRARYRPDFRYSGRLEMIVWSIPAMTVLLVGGVAWLGAHDLDPRKPIAANVAPLRVQVVSLDWKWLFIYPDQGVAAVNQLTIPVGVPVSFELTSSGVMNSFFVPQLGSQIYTMAGMTTRLHLQADHPGTYRGLSAQFSGDGFSDMRFNVEAVPAEGFARWGVGRRGAG